MKKKHWVTLSLIFSFLISFPSDIRANEATTRSGLTLIGGMFSPSLTLISEGPMYTDIGSFDAKTETIGEIVDIASFSVGLISRDASGFASRLAYLYRRDSEMVYTVSSAEDYEINYVADEKPKFKYSIHMLTISLMKHIRLVPRDLSVYLGGGIGGAIIYYPEKNNGVEYSPGITGFPLAGVELMIGRSMGFFAECQFHFGRTLDQHYSTDEGAGNLTIDYHYSLKGTHVLGGMNLYF